MEDCDEKELCLNECNKDHLATVAESSKKREDNTVKWLVCGFNGFGQLKFEHKRKLQQFEEISFNASGNVLLACSWNYLVAACECSLYIQGFLTNSTRAVRSLKSPSPVKLLDICDKFCLILMENGKVYKIIHGSENELNEVKFQTSVGNVGRKRNIFGEVKEYIELQIAHVACGNNITIAVSTTNSVFSGTIEVFQFAKHERVKQLKCGFEHALLLTSNGDIYACGNGLCVFWLNDLLTLFLINTFLRRGQLGSEVLRVEETPILIEALSGIKITSIAAGGWHSAAISAFADVYTWGFNSNGQLSLRVFKSSSETLKEPSVYPLPQLIEVTCQCCTNTCYPVNIAAGARHTILIMNCGSVYGCGWNEYGQLGVQKSQSFSESFEFVIKLKDFHNSNNKRIICGDWCTLIEK